METDPNHFRHRKRAAEISVVIGLLMFGMKLGGYYITGSAAILSDAIESVVHVLATVFVFCSVLLSSQPADDSHPYGHGKIEFFSAGIEGMLIVIAALAIIYTAVPKLIDPTALPDLGIGVGITGVAAVVNVVLGWYLIRVGRSHSSLTLVANGKHVLTDSLTSFGVVAGLGLVLLTDVKILDPLVALAVALNILVTGSKLMRQSVSGLMDEADPTLVSDITAALNNTRQPEWIDIHRLRCWKSGDTHHLDFHLTLPFYLQVARAHQIEAEMTEILHEQLDRPLQLLVHHDPCVPSCCSSCAVDPCKERRDDIKIQEIFHPERIVRPAQYLDEASGPTQ